MVAKVFMINSLFILAYSFPAFRLPPSSIINVTHFIEIDMSKMQSKHTSDITIKDEPGKILIYEEMREIGDIRLEMSDL
jgi:hypothetical protein